MKFPRFLLILLSTSMLVVFHPVWAQTTLVANITGTVSGTVQNDEGEDVTPQAAVDGTIVARLVDGAIEATIQGTASCTGGLGLHITFSGDYDVATGNFSIQYSDEPGQAPDTPADLEHLGGATWQVSMQGEAPSSNGPRPYNLQFTFEVPELGIYEGQEIPADKRYSGNLNHAISVPINLNIPELGVNTNETLNVDIAGSWEATAIPQIDESVVFSGSASGTLSSDSTSITGQGVLPNQVTVDYETSEVISHTFEDNRISLNETKDVTFNIVGSFVAIHDGDGSYTGSYTGTFSSSTYTLDNNSANVSVTFDITKIRSVTIPVIIENLGIYTSVSLDLQLDGAGTLDSSDDGLTGAASGTVSSSEATILGAATTSETIQISLAGDFGGSLFLELPDQVSFRGSWAAAGTGAFGGDVSISIPLNDVSNFPYTITGKAAIQTGIDSYPQIEIPINISGLIPLDVN